jgi:cytochrome c oxidase assembly protein subunit 15
MSQRTREERMRPVEYWLWLIAVLIAATVIVGGTTRLTGSGLSITEWRPLSGVLPPLTEGGWLAEFEKYKAIPQFLAVNPDMTLAGFKFIYWWEWTHRMLGRLIGVAFIVPFAAFWARGLIDRPLARKLAALFALGALQGTIGWWMVSSGLSERTDVSQYRLAVHLTLACAILAAVVATAVGLRPAPAEKVTKRARIGGAILLALIFVQIFVGALVAKTNAGLSFNTWPLIDGRFIPPFEQLFPIVPLWRNLFENVMTVQFVHRLVAYAIFVGAFLHAIDLQRSGPLRSAARAAVLFALVTAQAMIGIVALIWTVPLALALAHQAGAIAVLAVATLHLARISQAARP